MDLEENFLDEGDVEEVTRDEDVSESGGSDQTGPKITKTIHAEKKRVANGDLLRVLRVQMRKRARNRRPDRALRAQIHAGLVAVCTH